jgi:16S rRNA (uracil1498-N3)-methyltransferase
MPHDRFYHPDLSTPQILLTESEHHHLAHVMRIKEGEIIEVIDGQGTLAQGKVGKITKRDASITIEEIFSEEKKSPKLLLGQAALKFSNLEWVLEKGVEIGVDTFILFNSDSSEKLPYSPSQQKRLDHILISAIKQSGRLFLPEVIYLNHVSDLQEIKGYKVFGDLLEKTVKIKDLSLDSSPLMAIIGPEKGWSSKDISSLKHTVKATPVSLAPYILRAETAAIVALSQLLENLDW